MTEKNSVLILGATSSIARATCQAFAQQGYPLYLAGRNLSELERNAADLHIRYNIPVEYGYFDAEDTHSHPAFIQKMLSQIKNLGGVILAFGLLGDQTQAAQDFEEAQKIISTNYVAACSILTLCANVLTKQDKGGFIAAISSVAGDRGRQSNYVYGSAKGGLSLFLQGLRNRLFPSGIQVITIKPGFVDTSMTFGKPGMFLVASPERIGQGILRAVEKQKNVVYLPWFWKPIMWIITSIPESLFKRLRL